jgi:hypothetical protein
MEITGDVGQPVPWIPGSSPADVAGVAADNNWANFDGIAPAAAKASEDEAGWADFTTYNWPASQGNGSVFIQ